MAPVCGLCGKSDKLTQTKCCQNFICDDEDPSLDKYSTKSCFRNHQRESLCGCHADAGHAGPWQTCTKCSERFGCSKFCWMYSNEYNFKNLPKYECHMNCIECGEVILVKDFTCFKGYECISCFHKKREAGH